MARPHLAMERKPILEHAVVFLSPFYLSLSLALSPLARGLASPFCGDDYAYKNVISHRESTAHDACGLGWRACVGQAEIYD